MSSEKKAVVSLSPTIMEQRRARLMRLEAEVKTLRRLIAQSEGVWRPVVSFREFFSDARCSLSGNCNIFLVTLLVVVLFGLLILGHRGYGSVDKHVGTLLKHLDNLHTYLTTPASSQHTPVAFSLLPHLSTPLFNESRGNVHLGGPPGAGSCAGAVPVVSITGAATSLGAPKRGPSPQHYTPIPSLTSVPVGWIEITLSDLAPPDAPSGSWAPGVCYHGEDTPYTPERCPYEGGLAP